MAAGADLAVLSFYSKSAVDQGMEQDKFSDLRKPKVTKPSFLPTGGRGCPSSWSPCWVQEQAEASCNYYQGQFGCD